MAIFHTIVFNAGDLAVGTAPRRGVEEDVLPLARLREEAEFKVGRLLAHQGRGKDLGHGLLELVGDEVLDQRLPQGLLLAVAKQARGLGVPLRDCSGLVDAEDGRVRLRRDFSLSLFAPSIWCLFHRHRYEMVC